MQQFNLNSWQYLRVEHVIKASNWKLESNLSQSNEFHYIVEIPDKDIKYFQRLLDALNIKEYTQKKNEILKDIFREPSPEEYKVLDDYAAKKGYKLNINR